MNTLKKGKYIFVLKLRPFYFLLNVKTKFVTIFIFLIVLLFLLTVRDVVDSKS